MQLIPVTTKKRYIPSTAYLKLPLHAIIEKRFELNPELIPRLGMKEPIEASITFQPQRLIGELEKLYIVDNPKEIKNFLLTNDHLIDILFEAPDHIYRIFGQVPIYLELHHDPEEDWDELFIVIKSTYGAEEAVKLENRLVEEWFLSRIKDTKGKLNITEEPL